MRVVLSSNPYRDKGLRAGLEAKRILDKSGVEAILCLPFTPKKGERLDVPPYLKLVPLEQALKGANMMLCFGGDGTILHAARDVLEQDIPILGVNLGSVGFMAELERNELPLLTALSRNQYTLEERMMLCGSYEGGLDIAMNDIVLAREGKIRIINFNIYVDGSLLNSYHADGVIISTPTGSTGYNLSAGGPIVEPTAQMIVVTPICSHALNTSSIVLSADDTIEVEIGEGRYGRQEKVSLCFDGAEQITLVTGDRVVIRRSDRTARLIKLESESFMKTLRRKMKGN